MATRTIKVSGVEDSRKEPSELARGLPPEFVTVKGAALVQASRAGQPAVEFAGLDDDDVVEVELEDGVRVWSRVKDLAADLDAGPKRGGDAATFQIPSHLNAGPSSRALGGWAIKGLKVLGLDVPGEIAEFVAAHVEGKLQPGAGLYRCSESDPNALAPIGTLDGDGPILVFLHGTASSTSGSFAGLWMPLSGGLIKPIFEHYRGRVLGYQHRTLTQSPIENALELTKALAAVAGDAEVHLVSHSRGGLVGELLTRGPRSGGAGFAAEDHDLFKDDGRGRDREALQQLAEALESSRFRVKTFVRVACPARGTTLADGRLDRYLSVMVNLAGMVPGLKANPVYEGLTGLLAGVLKKRTEPRELPGIEAMMPTSPLIRMLNRPDVKTDSQLHVLGGDLAGAGLLGRLKTLVTDLYYREDHDLVVNTPAMLGGSERSLPIRYWIDTGDKVTHFNYFARPDTAGRLKSALLGSSDEFRTLTVRPSEVNKDSYVKRAAVGELKRPVVFVLPGIMGSQLTVADRRVWMSIRELAKGHFAQLASVNDAVPTGLLADGYSDLCEYLGQTHEVVPFPYDWRRSIRASAKKLREELDTVLPRAESANQPIRLLAHSMGGLVVRAMLGTDEGQKTWKRICQHPRARFIMLGTPNGGSHAIPAMLMGRDSLVKKLALVDLRSKHADLLGTIAGFDGVLNLLPHTNDSGFDFFDPAVWQELLDTDAPESRGLFGSSVATAKSAGFRWALPSEKALKDAKDVAALVRATTLDPERVLYVAGAADETACDIEIDDTAPKGRKVRVLATNRGDGRVLWETGVPKGVPVFYMDTVHGDMANDRRHFAAIADLLNEGQTSKLPKSPPTSRGAEERFEMRERLPAMIPDEAELVSDALGGRRARFAAGGAALKVKVRMVHDNLTNARSPVLASHYRHDTIIAAEAYLDGTLDGRLSELLRMEVYPGAINTGVVVLNDRTAASQSVHPGAIIAGLGHVGELTPGSLTSTLAHALTLYGAECVGRERRRRQRGESQDDDRAVIPAPVTAILIGSGEGGVSFGDSVRALLRAVQQANQRLHSPEPRTERRGAASLSAAIDQLDILELYEDRAIEALHILRTLSESPEFGDFVIEPYLERGDEGRRRVRYDQASGWWQRIRIMGDKKGSLAFEAVTQTARTPSRLRPTQRGLVDGFVDRAIASTQVDHRLGQTLFELLVPNDFKAYAPDRRKLALMLNPQAAGIPWELMHDGYDRAAEPLSVASGMIRQLLVQNERPQVLRSPSNTALVIGNPKVSDPQFPSLDGAREEAQQVAALIEGAKGIADSDRWQTSLLVEENASPMAVLSAIHEKPWRILHMAAHGVFEFKTGGELVTGLVLDNGLFFTAAEADQLRYVPELVFINCCHLGQTRGDARPHVAFHRLAANLATQFIKMGARAVVAAGWEVDDAAAKTFATRFYELMLGGEQFGDAVLDARKKTHINHGGTNTWGAYQCYGDVSFSLVKTTWAGRPPTFVSESELAVWLETLAARARESKGREKELLAELDDCIAATPPAWWKSSDVCARAAKAFYELNELHRAIGYYNSVPETERANAPIRSLEDFVSCKVRYAGQLLAKDRLTAQDRTTANELLDEAEKLLGSLLLIGRTSERLSLMGGYYKRRALYREGKARREALRKMQEMYAEAARRARDNGGDVLYPLGNQVAAEIVLSWTTSSKNGAKALEDLEKYSTATAAAAAASTEEFYLVAPVETELMKALAARKLDDKASKAIERKFADALSRGASARKLDSMRTQFRFFRAMAGTEFPPASRGPLVERLKWLEEKLFS